MHNQEFVQGSSTGAVLLGHTNLCTSPLPEMQDREFIQGSSTGLGPVFLGHIDLCTPSPSP
jgi:hypothetical protein